MTREDSDISAGYYLGKGFSAFVGYKDGTLTANVSGTAKVNLIRYDFKDTELGIPGGKGPEDFTFKEKFDVLSFTLAHYF